MKIFRASMISAIAFAILWGCHIVPYPRAMWCRLKEGHHMSTRGGIGATQNHLFSVEPTKRVGAGAAEPAHRIRTVRD